MQTSADKPPTWHESILEKIDQGNGVYVLIDDAYDAFAMRRIKVFAVKSDTDEMGFYYVIDFVNRTGTLRICTCDGYRYADHCKHTGRVPEK
jgi:hypothetical protein